MLASRMFRGVAATAVTAATAAGLYAYSTQASKRLPNALNPGEFVAFTLRQVIPLSENSALFRFELPAGTQLGLTTTSCLVTRTMEDGKAVVRPYTPIESPAPGTFDLCVKQYPEGTYLMRFGLL